MPKALARDVFIRGSTVSSPHFLVKTAAMTSTPTPALAPTLFAASISKKVASTAVLRNRTRRRVYSVIRDLLPRVKNTKPPLCVAISVKKGGETLAYEMMAKELENLLLKIRVI